MTKGGREMGTRELVFKVKVRVVDGEPDHAPDDAPTFDQIHQAFEHSLGVFSQEIERQLAVDYGADATIQVLS